MDIDVLKYKPVIADILTKLKVRKNDREDMTQECYLALLEKQKHLEHGIAIGDDDNYAAMICRGRIIDGWKRDKTRKFKDKPAVHLDSLSEPRVYRKVAKIRIPQIEEDPRATPDQLEAAILSLPFEEYRVMYELYVEGKTQETTASELGISPRTVWTRNQRGIELLKEYFGVED